MPNCITGKRKRKPRLNECERNSLINMLVFIRKQWRVCVNGGTTSTKLWFPVLKCWYRGKKLNWEMQKS